MGNGKPTVSDKKVVKHLAVKVVVITFNRLLLNTSRRFIYTFAPALGRAFGVPLTSITSLIAINQGTTVLGVLFAPLGDRFGYKNLMLTGLACLTAGMLASGILPFYVMLIFSLLLAGLGKSIFDPAIQAYVGQRVPFHRRGMVFGILELSWAGSTLIGIPLAGILIEKAGWQTVFITIGVLSLVGFFLILFFIARDNNTRKNQNAVKAPTALWKDLFKNRPAIGALVFAFFVCIANDNIFVVYAAWLEDSFHLSIVALGIGTGVVGAAEIAGELGTAALSDRIGLKKAVFSGLLLSILSFMVLPFTDKTLTLALLGLFFVFVSFEFLIVAAMSLFTELVPESRATMMSAFFACAGFGRVVGAMIGGPIWLSGGLPAISIVSAIFTFFSLTSLGWGLRYWKK